MPATMAAELHPEVKRLGAALATVTKEEAELEATQTAKDKALAANDVAFTSASRIGEGMLTLAGRADLAARMRPSSGRPGVTQKDEAEIKNASPRWLLCERSARRIVDGDHARASRRIRHDIKAAKTRIHQFAHVP